MTTPHALPPEFTIYALAGLRKDWLGQLPKSSRTKRAAARSPMAWRLDGSAVAEIDAAAVQLLVALSQTLSAGNRRLVLANASEPLANACTVLGLSSLLQDATETGAAA